MDFNVQSDVPPARQVMESSHPTLIPLSVTVETALRRAHLEALGRAGALGRLVARQAKAFAEDERMAEKYGPGCAGLPGDFINFQHDPLACAIAVGWDEGVEIEELPLVVEAQDGWLVERIDPAGTPMRVVTKIAGPQFDEFRLSTVTRRAPAS